MPHMNEDAVKPMTEAIKRFLRPKRDASQPVMGRMMAFATRYDVSTQVASSTEADMLPAICGSDTFTTVVSSTSMNVPNMTEMATIHGFTTGVAGFEFTRVAYRNLATRLQTDAAVLIREMHAVRY
jgi:hypothetical protein